MRTRRIQPIVLTLLSGGLGFSTSVYFQQGRTSDVALILSYIGAVAFASAITWVWISPRWRDR